MQPGLPESLFGINSSDLVGKPLAAFIDIFGQWRLKYGEDSSLLSMLAFYALHDADHQGGISLETDSMGRAWRVGVHLPLQDDEEILEHARGVEINTEHHQSQVQDEFADVTGAWFQALLCADAAWFCACGFLSRCKYASFIAYADQKETAHLCVCPASPK